MVTKTELHELIEEIPDRNVSEAARRLKDLRDSDYSLDDAPDDDEPVTAEDELSMARARDDVKMGRVVSHDEARSRLLG